ncbi:response regulator transcription factor [Sediminispirochaeta smaragdinae]|jgi:DNA-binding NarL/FixJ family response regulator|uniref:Two component transcriptional regulator, LuxR family n=1 Tax=Sediminispirochaeta smaragdinae (strain DSM 11293 / JCM 15392 / SEBR 4228) TaxID=573413 RepID=E1R158_SEDSS|nr:response regulator transcription factor [Sediminispirochaeta smaragdinae]ADK80878.1 two component transcriptional regulator, LuxR family [Sediminispirochaeta smaragdinae DSM 11293]
MNDKKSITCIVAEDFPELNNIYQSILNHEPDIRVVASVTSGRELLCAVEQYLPDVILMDIEMESPTAGIDYCRQISRSYPDIRIVILTCHEEEERVLSAFEAGAVDYLLKTDSMSDIIIAIKKAYKHSSPIHSYAAQMLRKQMRAMGHYKEELQKFTMAFMTLTPAEVGILKLLLDGYKQKEIAKYKHVELVTVKSHVTRILRKFSLRRTSEVVEMIRSLDAQEFVRQSKSV